MEPAEIEATSATGATGTGSNWRMEHKKHLKSAERKAKAAAGASGQKAKGSDMTTGERKMAEYIKTHYELTITPIIVDASGALGRKIYTDGKQVYSIECGCNGCRNDDEFGEKCKNLRGKPSKVPDTGIYVYIVSPGEYRTMCTEDTPPENKSDKLTHAKWLSKYAYFN